MNLDEESVPRSERHERVRSVRDSLISPPGEVAQSEDDLLPGALGSLRFDELRESEFLASFEQLGRTSRAHLWIVLLAAMAFVMVFHGVFLKLPAEVMPLAHLAILVVIVPAAMRWLSSAWSPIHRWSAQLFIGATLLDIACLMWLRVACVRQGYDVVPLIIPIGLLMSLIVSQIRFTLLAPVVALTLTGIVGVELWAFEVHSNGLFQIVAASAMVLVGLSPAYSLERWARIRWLRERLLNELARTDSLTGLANRRHFDAALRQAIRMAARERKSVALTILDIDQFKSYNDHYGHPAGDACLQSVGRYLTGAMRRPSDLAARLGGEEFATIWFDARPAEVPHLAEALRRGISGLGIAPAPGRGTTVTASAGVVQVIAPQAEDAADRIAVEMMRQADAALYRAKHGGRDSLVVLEEAITLEPAPSERHTSARSHLSHAPAPDSQNEPALEKANPLSKLRFDEPQESQFRARFDEQGRSARSLILFGLLAVIVLLLVFQRSLLRIPDDADLIGRLTLGLGLIPATLVALAGSHWPRLHRWSAELYIGAIYVILFAQMLERVIQLPKGYDVVPMMMPVALLLSMTVVQIQFRLLAPACLLALAGIVAAELVAFPLTTNRFLELAIAVLMTLVTLNFAYTLERWIRIGWLRKQMLNELACTDGLTRLANRRHFENSLRQAIRMAARERKNVALMILDIDHFKSYNDHYGHPAGDECLQCVGSYLAGAMRRPCDLAARLGGEEFAAIWFDALPDDVPRLADELRHGISELGIVPAPGRGIAVTASAGVVQVIAPQSEDAADRIAVEMMSQADAALYGAKHGGRNRLVMSPKGNKTERRSPPITSGSVEGSSQSWQVFTS